MRDFARTPKSPIFGDFAKGGPRQNGGKGRSNLGLQKHFSANSVICSLVCASSAEIGQHSGANGGSKSARKAQL